ncbi:MAG TPA: aspartyl protease family protein [Gemmataceae bacterium]|nr:aspartyl protease family protein [Gemmataceae bacterium]
METETMGRVVAEATIENLSDLYLAHRGVVPPEQVRRIVVPDALADTGATLLSIPTNLIRQLGLAQTGTRQVTSSVGPAQAAKYEAVRLTVMGRDCTMDVLEVPDGVPLLLGQLALEALDLVVDPPNRRLIGNPAHGGALVHEMY